jgi:hypothetical protein
MAGVMWAILLGIGTPVAGGEDGGCVVKRTAKGFYCVPCKRILGQDDMRFPAKTCKRCDEEAESIEFCVKRFPPIFRASCHPKKTSPRPFICDGKVHNIPEYKEDLARVTYRCKSCGATSMFSGELEHADDCANSFGVEKVCSKSGKEPHVGS